MKEGKRNKSFKFSKVLIALVLVVASVFGINTFINAEAGSVPDHQKNITDNGDGTHKLSLTITGDAETREHTDARANVVIIYDVSSSMVNNVKDSDYTRADQAEAVVYDFVDKLFSYKTECSL